MIDGKKIIVVIPSGRKQYLEILLPHIVNQTKYIDEIHFWLNTTNPKDIDYIKDIQKSNNRLYKIIYSKIPINYASSIYHFWYEACDSNTIYIRFDDDICWIDKNFIINLVECRLLNLKPLLIFPIIVNNDMNYGLVSKFGSDYYHHWYYYPEYGAQSHGLFFNWLKREYSNNFNFGNIKVPLERTLNINSICWIGEDIQKINFKTTSEEVEISHIIPNRLNRPHLICGSSVCCHFSFTSQREYIHKQTKYYQKYSVLSKNIQLCT